MISNRNSISWRYRWDSHNTLTVVRNFAFSCSVRIGWEKRKQPNLIDQSSVSVEDGRNHMKWKSTIHQPQHIAKTFRLQRLSTFSLFSDENRRANLNSTEKVPNEKDGISHERSKKSSANIYLLSITVNTSEVNWWFSVLQKDVDSFPLANNITS